MGKPTDTVSLPTLRACEPVECTFTIPAEIEAAWREGHRGELSACILQIAKDAAAYCARRYEQNLRERLVQ